MFDDRKWPHETSLKHASRDAIRLDDEEEEEEDEESEKGSKDGEFLGRSLIKARTILISDPVDHKLTARVTAQLLFLDHEDPEKPIKIFINSPGGSADYLRPDPVRSAAGEDYQRGSFGECCDGDHARCGEARPSRSSECTHHDTPALDAIVRCGRGHQADGRADPEAEAADQ